MNGNPTEKSECPCTFKTSLGASWDKLQKLPDKFGSAGKYKKVTHCIFDVDGTLLDSEDNYQRLVQTVVEKYGKKYTKELETQLYGGTDRDICTRIVEKLNLPVSVDEVENELFALSHKYLPQSPAKEGVVRLLNHLHKHKIPIAIASNSTTKAIELFSQDKPHIFNLFHHKVTATDPELKRGKPFPDMYLLAASRFPDKPKPTNCLAFEDSLTGVKAAKAAGMQVVMITSASLPNEEARLPTIVIRTLLLFKPELFGLPPFDDSDVPNKFQDKYKPFQSPISFLKNYTSPHTFGQTKYKKVTHCIFDVDGTLLDSEDNYQRLVQTVVEKYGKKYTKELEAELYGGTDRDICTRIVEKLSLPVSVDEVENELFALSHKYLPQSPAKEGVVRLLSHLHKNKIPFALASNSTTKAIQLYAKRKPYLFSLFHHKVTATDPELKRGKPYPDIYLLAASRFPDNPKPKSCLVFEDSICGVKAANAAEMQVVMITSKELSSEDAQLPTIVIRTLMHFKPEHFGLPSFDEECSSNRVAQWDWQNKFRDKDKQFHCPAGSFQDNYVSLDTSTQTKFKKVTHCIFDVDGTLLDSEDNYQQLVRTVVEKYGKKYTKELEAELYGGTDRDICARIVEKLSLPVSVDEVENELFSLSHKFLPQSPAKEGVVRLLTHLHKYKIPFALASNSTTKAIQLYAKKKPYLFSLFHHKVTATDPELKEGKPAPDIYLLAASRFSEKPKPRSCLVFEDSICGVKAARAAEMQVVMITSKTLTGEDARLPTLVIRTLMNFRPELFGLPPFDEVCRMAPSYTASAAMPKSACSNRGAALDWKNKLQDKYNSTGKFKKVTHCIFDVDGTLLDSEDNYQRLVQNVVEKYGKKYTKELEAELYGGTDKDICTRIVQKLKLPVTVDEVMKELFALSHKFLPQSPPKEGVIRLVNHLHKHKIPFAIASNSTKEAIELFSQAKPQIFNLFHHKVTATDPELKKGKPAPDIYLLAASRFPDKPKPRNCLAFEDSLTGVKAARAAGMQVVMITSQNLPPEEARLPTIVIRTLNHFKPELFGLPPFTS